MSDSVPPVRGAEYVFYVFLRSRADPNVFQANPTLAAGDVKVCTDDGAPANLATLPAVDADHTTRVKVTVSAAEMTGDCITVNFRDAAGAEWCDQAHVIHTTRDMSFKDLAAALIMNRTTIATLTSQKKFTLTAGSTDDDAYNGMICYVHDASTSVQRAVGFVWNYIGSTKEIELYENPGVFTMAAGDLVVLLPAPPAIRRMYDLSHFHFTTLATVTSQLGGTLTAGSSVDNAYNNCWAIIVDDADHAVRGVTVIDTYVGSTKTYTLRETPTGITAAAGDLIYILPRRLDFLTDLVMTRPTANYEGRVDTAPKCLGGAVAKAVHETEDIAGTLTVKNAAGSATLFTQAVTTAPGNDPIDKLGGATA